ncbi:MAG: SRPBCC family protein [Fimbriimonadaceae bacterium]
MTKLSAATTIRAPRETVFSAFTEFESFARVFHQAIAIDFLSERHTGLGTEWEQATQEGNVQILGIHKIISFDSPNTFTLTSDDRESFETMVFNFTQLDSETLVSFELTIKAKRFFAKLLTGILKSQLYEYMQVDLARIKAHIESAQ